MRRMIMVHTDIFEVGDKVTWRNDQYATLTKGRHRLGDGPFVITKVQLVTSSFRQVGHTQHVWIEGDDHEWSGAFWRRA